MTEAEVRAIEKRATRRTGVLSDVAHMEADCKTLLREVRRVQRASERLLAAAEEALAAGKLDALAVAVAEARATIPPLEETKPVGPWLREYVTTDAKKAP